MKARVLIVEDDAVFRRGLARIEAVLLASSPELIASTPPQRKPPRTKQPSPSANGAGRSR